VARQLLQPFKERYRQVGYADLWSLAGVVAVEGMGGPRVGWRAGRRDARSPTESVPHGRLPDGLLGASHLRTVFGRMGFGDHEIVALSGAHTVGRCHADRSGFVGAWTDRPLNFDNEYFQLLLQCTWQESSAPGTAAAQMTCPDHPDLMMLHTDVALVTDPAFRPYVERYAQSKEAFFKDFAAAYQKLQELGHEGLVKPHHF
jgi:catalase (peroxidase I)